MNLTFELPVEAVDAFVGKALEEAAKNLARDIYKAKPTESYQFEDVQDWHSYLEAFNLVLEYYGRQPIRVREVAEEAEHTT